ncbi:MAG: TetR/AcrR family transcriptional regulator [Thermoleophilaceae bacterium]
MAVRLSRAERTERNRSLVLDAARRVFMERGYHAATLEQIAEAAGFSKGVVYSQFESKADLFLALLDASIERRARENAQVVEGLAGGEGLAAMLEHVSRFQRAEPTWALLVLEFRVHAARNPDLNRRYAAAHRRTLAALSELLEGLYERAAEEPPFPPRRMAEIVLAVGAGTQLEQAADPDALDGPLAASVLARVLTRGEVTA